MWHCQKGTCLQNGSWPEDAEHPGVCAQQGPGASGDAPFHLCACLHMTAEGRELVLRLRTSFSEEESSQMWNPWGIRGDCVNLWIRDGGSESWQDQAKARVTRDRRNPSTVCLFVGLWQRDCLGQWKSFICWCGWWFEWTHFFFPKLIRLHLLFVNTSVKRKQWKIKQIFYISFSVHVYSYLK